MTLLAGFNVVQVGTSAAAIIIAFRIDETSNTHSQNENRGRTVKLAPDYDQRAYCAATFCLP